MSSIEVLEERCVGCELCIKACLYDAIEMVDGIAVIKDNCTLCGACVEPCKFDAIILRKEAQAERPSTEGYRGIWVVAEQKDGEVVRLEVTSTVGGALKLLSPWKGISAGGEVLASDERRIVTIETHAGETVVFKRTTSE